VPALLLVLKFVSFDATFQFSGPKQWCEEIPVDICDFFNIVAQQRFHSLMLPMLSSCYLLLDIRVFCLLTQQAAGIYMGHVVNVQSPNPVSSRFWNKGINPHKYCRLSRK
jgi:hypothetical protein